MNKKLQEKIVHFAYICTKKNTDQLFNRLIRKLYEKEILNGYSQIQAELYFPFDLEYLIFEVLEEAYNRRWKSVDLINGLEIAFQMAEYQLNSQARITSVWTGPTFDGKLIPFKTYETVKRLIDSANDEVFIVGYNFSFKHESIQSLFKRIEKAAERNCRINLVVNNDGSNYNELKNNWDKGQYLLNIYSWIGSDDGDYTSLHAKLIIIDQKKLFLTSANFSYHGFMKNIETGVVIENHQVIRDVWKQYQSLLKNNQINKVY